LIQERTRAGLEAARARGRKGGRRRGLSAEAQKKAMLAEVYYKEGKLGVDQIAKTVAASKMTLYKYFRLRGVRIGSTVS
jgi:DNA invertase Pin-like site-specific DNA recombinase